MHEREERRYKGYEKGGGCSDEKGAGCSDTFVAKA